MILWSQHNATEINISRRGQVENFVVWTRMFVYIVNWRPLQNNAGGGSRVTTSDLGWNIVDLLGKQSNLVASSQGENQREIRKLK